MTVANLACTVTIGRSYDPTKDVLRYTGQSNATQNPTKRQVLVDCNVTGNTIPTEVKLTCYTGSGVEISLVRFNPSPHLSQLLQRDYAWGKSGPAV
ncbi:hypothetical protein VTL71DRAFT_2348 [Oculimacula yallundae]|uniref:Uncharacterized protein n=1 Tax=Oculimacula yallundae TaxID=86028 RepID=A0ABR4C8M6_9HELO